MSEPGTQSSAAPLEGCYDGDPELLPVAEAVRRIDAQVSVIAGTEQVALRDALGRVLARSLVSPFDVPGHTNSAMDGYAMAGDELPAKLGRTFTVVGTAWAGKPYDVAVSAGEVVKVMTGAAMPTNTDTVIMQEHVDVLAENRVRIGAGHRPGQNVRARGEDLREGSIVLEQGTLVTPSELGLLGSLGMPEIPVKRRLRVAFFSTGDELKSLGETLGPGEIYDSNRYTLFGMLSRLGVDIVDMGVVRDDAGAVRQAIQDAARVADAIITSGGASTGEADYIRDTLAALGEVAFWRIAIRPGRPLAFGRVGDAMFFGLPGNPVAVMVTFYQFVQPALRRMRGERGAHHTPTVQATCANRLRKKSGRVEVYRAVLERDPQGKLTVRSTGKSGSGLLHTMSDANCFIVLPEDGEAVEPGEEVEVQPFFGIV